MNALELADGLDEDGYHHCADMLRQQQAEIDFLKKEILEKHEDWKHEGQQAANARAEIEALKSVVYWLKENRPEVWEDIQKWRKQ